MSKELEEAKREYRTLKRNRNIIAKIEPDYFFEFADTILNHIENSIPKEKLEEKIEENNKLIEECREDEEHCGEIYLYEHDNKVLQELLEGK